MGQKTNPIGFRVGTHRKWTSSWYNSDKGFFVTKASTFLSKGVLNPRGAAYVNGVETFIEKLIKHKLFSNYSKGSNYIPVDFRFYKGYAGYTYGFFIYTKLISTKK